MYLTIGARKRLHRITSAERDENGDSRFGALSGAHLWLPMCILTWVAMLTFIFVVL
jgi:hypothetical protein